MMVVGGVSGCQKEYNQSAYLVVETSKLIRTHFFCALKLEEESRMSDV
jgi:hypothetical protein